jgi:head-tail adaptor
MRAGSLRHTATIYQRATSPDAYGALDHTMTADSVTHKCSIKQRTFRERAENGQLMSRIEFELQFRYSPELELLNPGAQISVAGRLLEVLSSSDPKGKRQNVVIYAEDVR